MHFAAMSQRAMLVTEIVSGVIAFIVVIASFFAAIACTVVFIKAQQRKRVQAAREDSQGSNTWPSQEDVSEESSSEINDAYEDVNTPESVTEDMSTNDSLKVTVAYLSTSVVGNASEGTIHSSTGTKDRSSAGRNLSSWYGSSMVYSRENESIIAESSSYASQVGSIRTGTGKVISATESHTGKGRSATESHTGTGNGSTTESYSGDESTGGRDKLCIESINSSASSQTGDKRSSEENIWNVQSFSTGYGLRSGQDSSRIEASIINSSSGQGTASMSSHPNEDQSVLAETRSSDSDSKSKSSSSYDQSLSYSSFKSSQGKGESI